MFDEIDILEIIKSMIKPQYLGNSKINLRKNLSSYDSIIVTSEKTPYRDFNTSELLFARIKVNGKTQYISFPTKYHTLFDCANIMYTNIKSENFIRVGLDIFSPLSESFQKLPEIINKIFIDIFTFQAFGCCSKSMECSNAKHCVHDDLAYATACQYRKNLERGKIFYGINKNI